MHVTVTTIIQDTYNHYKKIGIYNEYEKYKPIIAFGVDLETLQPLITLQSIENEEIPDELKNINWNTSENGLKFLYLQTKE